MARKIHSNLTDEERELLEMARNRRDYMRDYMRRYRQENKPAKKPKVKVVDTGMSAAKAKRK